MKYVITVKYKLQSAGVAGLGGATSAALATGGAAVGAMAAKATDKKDWYRNIFNSWRFFFDLQEVNCSFFDAVFTIVLDLIIHFYEIEIEFAIIYKLEN